MSYDTIFTLDDLGLGDSNTENQNEEVTNVGESNDNIPGKGEESDPNINNQNDNNPDDGIPNSNINLEGLSSEELSDDTSDKQQDSVEESEEENKLKVPSSDDNISVFAQAFKEEGLLSELSEEELKGIKSFSDAVKYVQEEANRKVYDSLTPTQKRYMDSLSSGIAVNEFEELERELQAIEGITENTLRNDPKQQFTVLALNFIDKGVDRDLAQKMANTLVNQPEGLLEAVKAKDEMYSKKLEVYESRVNSKKEEHKFSVEKTKELVESKENILGKVQLSKTDKDKIFSKMTTRVDIVDGQQVNEFAKWRLEKGVEAEFILNALMHLTDGFTSLGKLGITAKNSAAKALENTLRQSEYKEVTDNSSESNPYNFNF